MCSLFANMQQVKPERTQNPWLKHGILHISLWGMCLNIWETNGSTLSNFPHLYWSPVGVAIRAEAD